MNTVATPNVALSQFAPSTAGIIVGAPSPSTFSLTQYIQAGNNALQSWGEVIGDLPKTTLGATTAVINQAKYKGDIILGTVAKNYNQALAAGYGAVADTGQAVITTVKKVETASFLIFFAIAAFLLFPYVMAFTRRK